MIFIKLFSSLLFASTLSITFISALPTTEFLGPGDLSTNRGGHEYARRSPKPPVSNSPGGKKTGSSGGKTSSSKGKTGGSKSPAEGTPQSTGKNSALSTHIQSTWLLPIKPVIGSWTTSKTLPNPLELSDQTFKPIISLHMHHYVEAPDKELSIQAIYPKGSWNFQQQPRGGFSFYSHGPLGKGVDLSKAKEVTFGFSAYFPKGFNFVKGGKIPGLYGGDSEGEALSCSGGRRSNGCWSARFMWRAKGQGELYTYLPPSYKANKAVCTVKPQSECNDKYGASVGRGAFQWKTGARTTVSQRVRLNDVGRANGELELFVDGKSVIKVEGLIYRAKNAGRIRGMQFQTFFGGSTKDFATPTNQQAFFSDFTLAVTKKL